MKIHYNEHTEALDKYSLNSIAEIIAKWSTGGIKNKDSTKSTVIIYKMTTGC